MHRQSAMSVHPLFLSLALCALVLPGCSRSGLLAQVAPDLSVAASDATFPPDLDECGGRPAWPPGVELPPEHGCGFGPSDARFPRLDKCCASDGDCALGIYQYSCCGDLLALGFRRDQQQRFDDATGRWSCALCACDGRGVNTEDGRYIGTTRPAVSCVAGYCMTYRP